MQKLITPPPPSELHMDLTNYYELKHQPHNLRLLTAGLGGAGLTGVSGAVPGVELDDRLALPQSSCSSSSSVAAVSRARSPLRAASRQSMASCGEATAASIMLPHHFLDGAPPKTAVISGADGRLSDYHLEELYKER